MLDMRIFLSALILIFSFQSWAKANDIRDFEIEGMSIGDSLLDIATEIQINKAKDYTQFPNDKFIIYQLDKLKDLEKYDWVSITTKKNDKNYTVTNIGGAINYEKLDRCLKLQKEVSILIENSFQSNEKQEQKYPTKQDKTGNSIVYGVTYYLKPYPSNEGIVINCYHMTDASNTKRSLKVTVNSEEYAYFIINEAYN